MRTKKIVPVVCVLVLLIAFCYVLFFTNLLLNHSCAGITLASINPDTELIVRYFDSEREAKRFYKGMEIEAYYLTVVDADFTRTTTEEWFRALPAPLVGEKAKYVQLSGENAEALFGSFMDNQHLMIYEKGAGLDDGGIDKDELDTSLSLVSLGSYSYSWLDESYTEEERSYAFSNMLLNENIALCVANLDESEKENDAYSIAYWRNTLTEYVLGFDCGAVPALVRENINWMEEAEQFSACRENISRAIEQGVKADDMKAYRLVYEARAVSLFAKMHQSAGEVLESYELKPEEEQEPEAEETGKSWWKNDFRYASENGDRFEIMWHDDDLMVFTFEDGEQYELHGDSGEVCVADGTLLYTFAAIEIKYNGQDGSVWIQNGSHEGMYFPQYE